MTLTGIKELKPNPKLVERLESLLEKARSGEIHSMIYVLGHHADWVSRGIETDARCHARIMHSYLVQVAVEYTMLRITRDGDSMVGGLSDAT